jgi:hypothetical protein
MAIRKKFGLKQFWGPQGLMVRVWELAIDAPFHGGSIRPRILYCRNSLLPVSLTPAITFSPGDINTDQK